MNARVDPWNDYARIFSAITSRFQQEMYELAASRLCGSVIDCGCGAGKLLPYLVAEGGTSAYLGIDSSREMIARAEELVSLFPGFAARVERRAIEQSVGTFDAAVSLQSYYSWRDGAVMLERIRGLLGAGGTFVLASANDELDIERLLSIASRELLMHPDWNEFARLNRGLAGTPGGNFVSLDTLVRESRAAGFQVREAHTTLYEGGLSFLVLAA